MLNIDELDRYARHINLEQIGLDGQIKLKGSKVLLVGAGGLGNPAAAYLAAAGIGHLTIADGDSIELSNLQRQILFNTADVGQKKADVVSKRLRAMNPDIAVTSFPYYIDADNVENLVADHHIIIDGSDSFSTRFLVNDACIQLGKPLVFGSVLKFQGQVTVINYKDGPCLRCIFPEEPEAQYLPSCSEAGVLGVVPALVASIQVTEAIKVLLGLSKTLSSRLLCIDTLSMLFSEYDVVKSTSCECNLAVFAVANTPIGTEERYADLPAPTHSPKTSCSNLMHWFQNNASMHIIDVRSNEEFTVKAIETSINIPLAELRFAALNYDREDLIIVYCQSGARSAIAQQYLLNMGFLNVLDLDGGIEQWSKTAWS